MECGPLLQHATVYDAQRVPFESSFLSGLDCLHVGESITL
jgi:hypothetical protein